MTHVPVMMGEVLEALRPSAGQTYLDGTLGLAGHALQVGARIAPGGLVVGLDWDEKMLSEARTRLASLEGVEVELFQADYREAPECLSEAQRRHGRQGGANAVLLDLGVNNMHFEDAERGMSFARSGPLDMRMDRRRPETAAGLVARLSASELEKVLFELGGEHWARKIAAVIVDRRKKSPIRTTDDLVDCVLAAVPAAKRDRRIHPATRTFQALRIAVNHELDGLSGAVEAIARSLAPGGTLVVLSYHSGEDRHVKQVFRTLRTEGGYETLSKRPIVPTETEVQDNPKSRSAKMRALRRCA
ncbi:MAG: 16S rRNA (cytosine(1402)-N(4))-methyltransferase RsmH [Fimbriimonadaceae bacterium]